ncbi:hypothetical protein GIB67_035547, partial [Kingdonia uniflora]
LFTASSSSSSLNINVRSRRLLRSFSSPISDPSPLTTNLVNVSRSFNFPIPRGKHSSLEHPSNSSCLKLTNVCRLNKLLTVSGTSSNFVLSTSSCLKLNHFPHIIRKFLKLATIIKFQCL